MMRLSFLTLGLAVLTLGASATAAEYRIGPAPGGRFALEVEKTGLLKGKKHVFVFERYKGRLDYDEAQPEKSNVEFVIESASIVSTDDWVSEKDKKKVMKAALEDMLAAEKYREIKFAGSGARDNGDGSFTVPGTLTLRGIGKPASVTVKLAPQAGGLRFDGSAKVKLTDYGLKPPSAALGAVGTKDEMLVTFVLIAAK